MYRRHWLGGLTAMGALAANSIAAADESSPAVALPVATPCQPPALKVRELIQELRNGNPCEFYGRDLVFQGTILRVGKGVDQGIVPRVAFVDFEDQPDFLYGTAYVHNVNSDFVGKAGERVEGRGMIAAQCYGVWFLWSREWKIVKPA